MAKQIVNKDLIVIPQGTMEDFNRPDHPDFKTSRELEGIKFSGLRHNRLNNTAELWLLGNLEGVVTHEQILLNPMAINEMYERVFCLEEIMPDTPQARAFIAIRNAMKKE